jgi:1-acyl-sn-glycerol-3-phosphate acyltransferase
LTIANFARSLIFYVGALASLTVFAPLALVLWPLPYGLRYRIVTSWAHLAVWWLEKSCGLGWRVTGIEQLPPGPAIIMCKHQSAWETFAIQKIFPPHCWVLKREVLWLPLFGWGLATLKPISIDRSAVRRALRQVVAQGRERLEEGLWIAVFPEGTRVRPGERRSYGIGGAYLAEQTGFPVVPVAHNAGAYWPRQSITKRPGTIEVAIGPVIDPRGKSASEINTMAEEWIEATSAQLLAKASPRSA